MRLGGRMIVEDVLNCVWGISAKLRVTSNARCMILRVCARRLQKDNIADCFPGIERVRIMTWCYSLSAATNRQRFFAGLRKGEPPVSVRLVRTDLESQFQWAAG